MRRDVWLLLAAVPVGITVIADALRSDAPAFWLGAAVATVAAAAAFTHCVLRPMQANTGRPEPTPARISAPRAWVGLGMLAILSAGVVLGAPHSMSAAPILLALILEAAWSSRTSG